MPRQARRKKQLTKAPKEIVFKRTYKQSLFMDCTADEVLFGGAAGGGKSYAQLLDALKDAMQYPGIKQLILRETFPELSRSLIQTSLEIYPQQAGTYNAGEHKWYFYNGSMIEFGYLESDSSVGIYQSAEYDIIRIDEATHMSQYRITYMKSRIRGANDFPKQLKMTTNPGGIGHKYLKKAFRVGTSEPMVPFTVSLGKDEKGNEMKVTRCYIPARVYDNEFLLEKNPNYIANLMQLPEKEKKALLDGDWDIFDDQAFPEFDYNIHVCKPFKIPKHWKRWRSVDNGYDDPFAWYWFAVDEQGTVYIYREYTREKDSSRVKYSDQARRVVEKSRYIDVFNGREVEIEEKFDFTVAGHDAFATHVRDEQGKTLIDYYNDGGVYGFIKAITDRRLRKSVWHEYLDPYLDENTGKMTAKVQIFDTCRKLIETLPEQLKDPDDNEKVAESDNDHWYDGAGYGLIAYHSKRSKGLRPAKTEVEKDMERLWKASIRGRKRRLM